MPITRIRIALECGVTFESRELSAHLPRAHRHTSFSEDTVHVSRSYRCFTIGKQLLDDAVHGSCTSLFETHELDPNLILPNAIPDTRAAGVLYQKVATPARAGCVDNTLILSVVRHEDLVLPP